MDSITRSSDNLSSIHVQHPSLLAGSDMPEDVITGEVCQTCQKKAVSHLVEAKWYCKDCEELICDGCKSLHKIFKPMAGHKLVALHPPCTDCVNTGGNVAADCFCMECLVFLCDACKSGHESNHKIIKSGDHIKAQNKIPTQGRATESSPTNQASKTEGSTSMVYKTESSTTNKANKSKESFGMAQLPQVTQPHETKASYIRYTAKYESKFKVTIPRDSKPPDVQTPDISGSSSLPDSRLFLVDRGNQKLKLYDAYGRFVTQKQFNEKPYDISVYDNSEVAVTVGCDIVRLSVVGDVIAEKGTISPGFACCCGVSYLSNDMVVVTGRDKVKFDDVLCVYNTDGTHLSRYTLKEREAPDHVAVDQAKSRAYVSTPATHIVSAIDLNTNKVVFRYKHKHLSSPRGVAVDKDHNLYVCGMFSQNIHQVSPKGEHVKILVSGKDLFSPWRLCKPQTMSFTPGGDRFIVSSEKSNTIQVYTLQ